ncbi:MAG: hypothetical protein ACRCTW_11740 [Lactococcus garvieae]
MVNNEIYLRLESLLSELDQILVALKNDGLQFHPGLMPPTGSFNDLLTNPLYSHLGVADGHAAFGLPVLFEEIDEYRKDPTAFAAKKLGVTKSHYEKWLDALNNGQKCWALTKNNKPCESTCFSRLPKNPADYNPNKPVYCNIHKDRAETVKLDPTRLHKSQVQ